MDKLLSRKANINRGSKKSRERLMDAILNTIDLNVNAILNINPIVMQLFGLSQKVNREQLIKIDEGGEILNHICLKI